MMLSSTDASKAFELVAAGASDVGCVRSRNEDSFFVDVEHGLFIVADGLGGHNAGDKAAQMATQYLPGIVQHKLPDAPYPCSSGDADIATLLAKSLEEVSALILETGNSQRELKGMGTTVVAALVTSHHVHVAYMGDSRGYLLRGSGMQQLTEDHSLVALLLRHGEITQQEAEDHPARGRLSRFAGMSGEVTAATKTIALEAGDRVLLCTDGLWGTVCDVDIKKMLMRDEPPEDVCRNLIEAGKSAGGQDNLTAVIVDLEMI